MKEVIRKEIILNLDETIKILEVKEVTDIEKLKELSEKSIEFVAMHKDLDLVSITVMIYSLYKIVNNIPDKDRQDLLVEVKNAQKFIQQSNLHRYNKSIRTLFEIIKRTNNQIKEHFNDVMVAARIKKSASLLSKGLSIGQAAGLMGLSNWDLQQYAGHSTTYEEHKEKLPAVKRLRTALKLFGM